MKQEQRTENKFSDLFILFIISHIKHGGALLRDKILTEKSI